MGELMTSDEVATVLRISREEAAEQTAAGWIPTDRAAVMRLAADIAAKSGRKITQRARVVEVVRRLDRVTAAVVAEQTGIDVDAASVCLAKLARSGLARRIGLGWYATVDGPTEPPALSGPATSAQSRPVSRRSLAMLEVVRRRGEASPAEVAAEVGVSSATAATYLTRLADAGRLRRIARGVYAMPDGG